MSPLGTWSKPIIHFIGSSLVGLLVLLFAVNAAAAPCDIKNNAPDILRHDLTGSASTSNSYCELCGYGYVTVIIANPYAGVDMEDLTLVENLGTSGLTYDPTAPNPITYSLNGGPAFPGGAPAISGGNGSLLTWTPAQIPPLAQLDFRPGNGFDTLAVTFAVTRAGGLTQEGLISATRLIEAQLRYDTDGICFPGTQVATTGVDILPLREPIPELIKRGRNTDAGQGSGQYAQTVYGNVNDDVIWRIRVRNTGLADLQDLRFDDLMQSGNLEVNYACPTESAASAVTANNGIDPGGTGCVAAGNSISNFDVDNPFGNPGNDSPDLVDAQQGANTYIYLVGKIPEAPNGSCSANRTNTVSDLQWGCQADAPAGGISATSTGSSPGSASATLSTLSVNSGSNLNIQTELLGTNTSQPAGSKGTLRITIANNTGGSIKGLYLRDVLPPEYVVDSTFAPTLEVDPAYGNYLGMTDRIEWTNPAAGTFPLVTGDPAVALSNTAPEFRLYSSTSHPLYPDQVDMLRHGDELIVTFRVVLVRPLSYDRVANLDVRTEAPTSDPAGTDPDNGIQVSNQLFVDFENFCQPGVTQHPPTNPLVTNHQTDPEDLDIDIAGSELIFILTGDPNQRLPLTVNLTNRGGHDAADYLAYISFGTTMAVASVPAGCSVTANPPALDEWQEPAPIPGDATIYQCTGPAIPPGATRALAFEVVKSTDPAALAADDLTFRADVTGRITLSDGTPLWFPTPVNPRADGGNDPANNYSLDGIRARVVGFNLLKSQVGNCTENNPPPTSPDRHVQIGEECSYHIDTGGWFGFQTPGFTYIAVQDIQVVDQLPDGQGYLTSSDPLLTSTSAIQGVSLNPPGLAPLDEVAAPEWLNWTFNQLVPAERITEKDHWFRVDLSSRLLNDPVDLSAVPNLHAAASINVLNSFFQAVFFNDSTGLEEVYDLGPGTVGYPREEVRRVELTVTEPQLTLVKEVCNETLFGSGPACSNFVPLAADGDAFDSYIYRLSLSNEASSGGVPRAPAYDVVVTDQLDASDLALILPLAGDGLDNDGDGASGGADADGEGSISDNLVKNGTPAQITFSYTHSSALQRIDPGQTVRLYYRVDFDDDAAPLQTFDNSAAGTYDSLTGPSGNQSAPQRPNSDPGGARVYTISPASAAVRIIPVEVQPKRIAALANTPLAAGPGPQEAVIGEELEYRLNTLLPVALLRNFVIRDELPAGLRCSEAPPVNLDAAPYATASFVPGGTITPTCADGFVEWNFGDQRVTNGNLGDRYDFEIGFIARVENSAGTNDGDVLSNGNPATLATARYIDETGNQVSLDFGQVDLLLREPRLELSKTFGAASADAGDLLTVTVTASNTGTATAYNLRVLDDLVGRNLTYVGNLGGGNPPDAVDTATLGANRPIFSWNPGTGIPVGATIDFSFEVRVDDVAQPLEILENTVQADWTSLPGQTTALNSSGSIGADGSPTGMRIGALPNAGDALNDYESTAAHQVPVPPLAFAKTDLDPALVPAIGAHKTFRLEISLPEGTSHGVSVSDQLDAAGVSYLLENNATFDISYSFPGIAAINGQPPGEAAFNAFPADGSSGGIVWDIGSVKTQTENDPDESAIAPLIRIEYAARINNDLVTDAGDTLQNAAQLVYTNGATDGQESLNDATAAVTVVEPLLAVVKTVSNVTPGKLPTDPPAGGDLLEYAVSVLNSGTATAHDVNLVDTLPPGLTLYAGFTPTAAIDGIPAAAFVTTPANAPAGPLVWGQGNGDGSLDIPVGQSLVLTYQTVVQAAGGDLVNRVFVDWTSLDAVSGFERTGAGCPDWTAPDDYCVGPATAATTSVDENSLAKTVLADSFDTPPLSTAGDAIARVGDIVTYRLSLNLSGGLTRNLRVRDTLPAGMAFAETVSINGDTSVDFIPPASGPGSNFSYAPITAAALPSAGQTGTLSWTVGDLVNDPFGDPSTDSLEIVYRARIMPDAGIAQVPSTTLPNSAAMDYDTAGGPAPTQTASAEVTLLQPELTVSKSALAAGGDTLLEAGELVTYTLEIVNTGAAPAYDTVLTDIVPFGMRNGAATISVTEMRLLTGTVWPNLAPVYAPDSGTLTWDFDSGTADQYSIPPGDTLRIVYQLQADPDLGAGLTLTNQAQVQRYHSFDDEGVPTAGSTTGERETYGPSNLASVTFTTALPDPPLKENPPVTSVSVGELFSYRITVPATPQPLALHDVRVLDDLGASAAELSFVSVTKVSGSGPWTPVNTGSATSLVIEDPAVGIDIPAGEQIVLEITVVLADVPANVIGLPFSNTAAYTFNQLGDDPATRTDGGSDTTGDLTIVGVEALTLQKRGPAAVQAGSPAVFTLDVHNPGTGIAWNPTLSDLLPLEATGGMCAAAPDNVTAQLFAADGTTPVSALLVLDSDFSLSFAGAPDCRWTFNLLSPAGGIGPDQRLRVNYTAQLDPGSENGLSLTNIAGVTGWFSADPEIPGATPRTFLRSLTDGTPGALDHEDSHTLTAEAPILSFRKRVQNLTTGQNPGRNATPGDTLRYTLEISNQGPVGLAAFSILDELDRLNPEPAFAPGSLSLVTVPAGADTAATSATGGARGTGLLQVANLGIGAQGEPNDTLTLEFDVQLAPVITSGTLVRNQAELVTAVPAPLPSDDPDLPGDADPTETLIASAPRLEVLKTSSILSGDPNVLLAGESLRYTLSIRNLGTEDALDARLRDFMPANTSYLAGSTTLNGAPVADPAPGVSPLQAGLLLNAPEDATPGYLRADATPGATNQATVTFDVMVDPTVMDGLIIENQGFVAGTGAGSGPQPEQPSDDPGTPVPDDPTRNVVGNLPLLYAQKTVQLETDLGSPGIVDPGDVLRYTIRIDNLGAIPATSVVFSDPVPLNTTYVADSLRLNGAPLGPDGGLSPLIAGLAVQSADGPGVGILSPGNSAEVSFAVQVDAGVATGTLISNQGSVTSAELPPELTDADGLPANGRQPTVVVVGDVQLLSLTKEVLVVGGGAAEAGGQLEYVLRATNIGLLPATRVVLRDDLAPPLGNQASYVAASGTLNGSPAGVSFAGSLLSADFAAQYGDLAPGASAVLRFRVQLAADLAIGTTVSNTGEVRWNNPAQSATASVSLDIGGTPGSAILNGNVWHDADLDRAYVDTEHHLEGWSVELYAGSNLLVSALTDAAGSYRLAGLVPNDTTGEPYELRFRAPGAGPNTPSLGYADSPFTDGPQRINAISLASGANLQGLNLPLWPNGAVYDAVLRTPVAGARLAMLNATSETPLPTGCFDDPAQQNQVTALDGFYKFDINFSDPACPPGGTYFIEVTPPAGGYLTGPSRIIPPNGEPAAPFSVSACPGGLEDAIPATAELCEVTASALLPPLDVAPRTDGTLYHLHLSLSNVLMPGQSQAFNNHIPVDPVLNGAVAITKTASRINISKGELVPYTITISNLFAAPLTDLAILDRFPAGFKYVADSARLDGDPLEPVVRGRELVWEGLDLQFNQTRTLQLLLVVGAGVGEGEYVNRAQVLNTATGGSVSGEAAATVRVVPDPTFDCTDVIGKVFDDRNLNGWQDPGETGLAGARVVTARGLIATSDEYGRFHITCAALPDAVRGSNFILKLDDRSLPAGYRLTTENPRVQHATRGKLLKFNFGATIHRVVGLDFADGVFEPETAELRLQWAPKLAQLIEELKKGPSVLRLSYLADIESEELVEERLGALKRDIARQWEAAAGDYRLTIESEVFWRRGKPVK